MGSAEDGNKNLVEFLPIHIHDLTEMQGITLRIQNRLRENAVGDGYGIGTADTNNGNGSTWRGRKGANSIGHLIKIED